MADFMQIIDVNESGVERVLHPETNADFVVSGTVYKVPKIMEITDWNLRSQELVEARKGKATLKLKIDEIDTALIPTNLLETIKGVDGSGSGLDADTVDGRTVDDTSDSGLNLWTAAKVVSELAKKLDNTEAVTTATANKILRLNSNGLLPTGITGNSATSTRLQNALKIDFTGDVVGTVSFSGNEGVRSVDLQVNNNSHTHSSLTGSLLTLDSIGSGNIVNFSVNGSLKSFIGSDGSFSGSSAKVMGFTVDNTKDNSLWTGSKVKTSATEIATIVGEQVLDKANLDAVLISQTEAQTIVEAELQQYAAKNDLGISLGPVNFIHGEITIDGLNSVNINLPTGINEVLSENYIITSSDRTMTFVKDITSNSTLSVIKLNKIAPAGSKINWYLTTI